MSDVCRQAHDFTTGAKEREQNAINQLPTERAAPAQQLLKERVGVTKARLGTP